MKTPNGLQQLIDTFGDPRPMIGPDGTIGHLWENRQMITVPLPLPIPLSWDPKVKASRIRCHKLLGPTVEELFKAVHKRGLWRHIKSYGGCYAFRPMRGASKLSTHCWGVAIDLNVSTNQLGTRGDMAPELIAIFREFGFTWGGEWKRPDPQHFQFCRGY